MTSCLKKTDIYATSISPTYNGLKTFPTTYGGCLSILSYIIVLGWLTYQFLLIWVLKEGTISVYGSTVSDSSESSSLWKITSQEMLITNNLTSYNNDIFKEPYYRYLTVLYIQTYNNEDNSITQNYYNSKPCNEVLSEDDPRLSLLDL